MKRFSKRAGEERTIINPIKKRQTEWKGHTLRQGDLLAKAIEGHIEGKTPQGTRRIGLKDRINDGCPTQE